MLSSSQSLIHYLFFDNLKKRLAGLNQAQF